MKKELIKAFGERIKKEDGEIDRKELGRIVFNHPKKLEKLNSITHKYIFEYMDLWIAEQEKRGVDRVIIDAPVLFESGLNKECDLIIAVIASDENRIKRIVERDGLTEEEEALKRIRAQKPNQFYFDNGCYIIENNGGFGELELAVCEAELLIDYKATYPVTYEIDTDIFKS
jgi:dephospho-CoA kinase